jgi:hypothetical protein
MQKGKPLKVPKAKNYKDSIYAANEDVRRAIDALYVERWQRTKDVAITLITGILFGMLIK